MYTSQLEHLAQTATLVCVYSNLFEETDNLYCMRTCVVL